MGERKTRDARNKLLSHQKNSGSTINQVKSASAIKLIPAPGHDEGYTTNWGDGWEENLERKKRKGNDSRIDTAIILAIIRDLGPATPDDLAAGGDEAEFADVDLDDGTLGEHAELGVHRVLWVLLDGDDG